MSITANGRPNVLLLNLLGDREMTESLLSQLLDSLSSCVGVAWAETRKEFDIKMKSHKPSVVFSVDAGISDPKHTAILHSLVRYVKEDAGIVVCCGCFGNHLSYAEAPRFFSAWGVPWRAGSYFRTTIHLTKVPVEGVALEGLPTSYSAKSLSLSNVARKHSLYGPSSDSQIESHVFAPDAFPVDIQETSCAYIALGKGFLGYVGDVNCEEGSVKVTLAMGHLSPHAMVPAKSKDYSMTFYPPATVGGNGFFKKTPIADGGDGGRDASPMTVVYSDALRAPGASEMLIGSKMEGGSKLSGSNVPAATNPPPVPVRPRRVENRRPREEEVEARAEKRAVVSQRKLEAAEELKDLGNDLFRRGEFDDALEMYHGSVEIRGARPVYMSNIAAACLKAKMYEEAEDACDVVLEYEPRNLKARYRRGLARRAMVKFRDAMLDFNACSELDPEDPLFPQEEAKTRDAYKKFKAGNVEDYELDDVEYDYESDQSLAEYDFGMLAWAEIHKENKGKGKVSQGKGKWKGKGKGKGKRKPKQEPKLKSLYVPPLDAPAYDYESESDSSDFEHVGNGIPCKHYNNKPAGCRYGAAGCRYKHAPTAFDTTRDELGRNVCNFWLVGNCKFVEKCWYAHSKEYLPEKGWWLGGPRYDKIKTLTAEMNNLTKYEKYSYMSERQQDRVLERMLRNMGMGDGGMDSDEEEMYFGYKSGRGFLPNGEMYEYNF